MGDQDGWTKVNEADLIGDLAPPVPEMASLDPYPGSEERLPVEREQERLAPKEDPVKSTDPTSPPKPDIPEKAMLHIIDEDLNLTNDLQEYMEKKWKLADNGMDYHLVAVFGSQSTGKSTLLNLIFQTDFETMKENRRQQTTKGLWLSVGQPSNILVMDVEGTDGRERGENQDMERKSAVFSLAISQVLIINMFEHDVGRYNGANYGLLKTVFDVNLQLFQASGSPKTLLMFVIRDHTQTPLENLAQTLRTDMTKIWGDLSKPAGFENSIIDDFFDLKFIGLPHKLYENEKFVAAVDKFREWFRNANDPNYLFSQKYHKQIPADGFYKFVSDIWEKINSNKDLDLPTQKQLLAQFRCTEIANGCLAKLTNNLKEIKKSVETDTIPSNLATQFADMRNSALAEYHESAHRYDESVFKRIKEELKSNIQLALFPIFTNCIQILRKKAYSSFFKAFDESIAKETKVPFQAIAKQLKEEALSSFIEPASALLLTETDWSYDSELNELKDSLTKEIARRKEIQSEKSLADFKKSLQYALVEPISEILGPAKENVWSEIQKVLLRNVNLTGIFVDKFGNDFGLSSEESAEIKKSLHATILETARRRLDDELVDSLFYAKLRKKFEIHFKYDDAHRPRTWKSIEEINPRFDDAKIKAASFLKLFAQPDSSLDLSILDPEAKWGKLLSDEKQKNVWERFEIEANAIYQEAVKSTTQTTAQIPPWFFALLLVLGWNELWTVLTNPLYLITVIIVGGGLYTVFALHLEGAAVQLAQTVGTEAVRIGSEKIQEVINPAQKKGLRTM